MTDVTPQADTTPVEDVTTPAVVRAQDGRGRLLRAALLLLALAGAALAAVLSPHPGRAAVSYLGALAFAGVLFTLAVSAVRWAAHTSATLAMLVAMMTYTLTVVFMALLLAVLDPEVVAPGAFAAGLVVAVALWITEQVKAARPPDDVSRPAGFVIYDDADEEDVEWTGHRTDDSKRD